MARVIGKDTYLVKQKNDHSLNGIFLIYILLIVDITYFIFIWKFHPSPFTSMIVGGVSILIYIIFSKPINKEIRLKWDYTYGLLGEESIAKILSRLPDSYIALANVVIPGKHSNIDFVVVGPTGVFAIEVKSHSGKISYDRGQLFRNGKKFESDFLRQVKSEAYSLHEYLTNAHLNCSFIQPILVFSNRFASVRFGTKPIDGVMVIGASWLNQSILSHPNASTFTQIQINELLRSLQKLIKIDGSA